MKVCRNPTQHLWASVLSVGRDQPLRAARASRRRLVWGALAAAAGAPLAIWLWTHLL